MSETTELTFPCSQCNHHCCHEFIIVSGPEAEAIGWHVQNYPVAIYPNENKCCFLNPSTQQCEIYPIRPLICRLYGQVEELKCNQVGKIVLTNKLSTLNRMIRVAKASAKLFPKLIFHYKSFSEEADF